MRNRAIPLIAAVVLFASCGGNGNSADTTAPASPTTAPTTTRVPEPSWEKVTPPKIDGATDAVLVRNGTLADGRYWSSISRVSGSDNIVFTVVRAYFGAACTKWATERGMTEGCMNDYAVDDADSALVALADDASASVVFQEGPGTTYAINAATLRDLVFGTATSPITNYKWVPFPFVVTVKNGVVVAADQFWVP